jgi:hypothetical protein
VFCLEQFARALGSIERNTTSGIAGITGFLLYAAGIIIREAA